MCISIWVHIYIYKLYNNTNWENQTIYKVQIKIFKYQHYIKTEPKNKNYANKYF